MACYNVSAEVTLYALVELQIDARNPEVAEQLARAELSRYQPSLPDGGVYAVEVNEITTWKSPRGAL